MKKTNRGGWKICSRGHSIVAQDRVRSAGRVGDGNGKNEVSMLTPLPVVGFALVCAIGAYGIQNRTRWAWYGVWVVMLFAAVVFAVPLIVALSAASTASGFIAALIASAGTALLFTGWATWWYRHRRIVGIRPKPQPNLPPQR